MSRVDRSDPGPRVAAVQAATDGVQRVGYPIRVRTLQLLDRELVTDSMLRITLGGPGLAGLERHAPDDHVRIVMPLPDGTRNDPRPDGDTLDWGHPSPPSRCYTIRSIDADAGTLDIDVVVHPGGLVSQWAGQAVIGEDVVLAGPPGAKAFGYGYEHYLFAIDTTALPAVAAWLEQAPAGVSAEVFVDHDHAHERDYPLPELPEVSVTWLDRSGGSRLADEVSRARLVPGGTFLYAAGEAEDLRPLRQWGREFCAATLVTGYWKRGVDDFDD